MESTSGSGKDKDKNGTSEMNKETCKKMKGGPNGGYGTKKKHGAIIIIPKMIQLPIKFKLKDSLEDKLEEEEYDEDSSLRDDDEELGTEDTTHDEDEDFYGKELVSEDFESTDSDSEELGSQDCESEDSHSKEFVIENSSLEDEEINEDNGASKDDWNRWYQIDLDHLNGIQMGFAGDGILWTCCENPKVNNHEDQQPTEKKGLLQFYVYSPIDFKLQVVESRVINSVVIRKAKVVFHTSVSGERFEYYVLLTDANELIAFDMHTAHIDSYLLLEKADPKKDTLFKDFEVRYDPNQIVLVEKMANGDVHSLSILEFPPDWENVSIIHCEDLSIELSLHFPYCVIMQNLGQLTVALYSQFIEDCSSNVSPMVRSQLHYSLVITSEKRIQGLPKSIIRVNMINPTTKFLNVRPPMLCVDDARGGKAFYIAHENDKNGKNDDVTIFLPVYRLKSNKVGQLGDDFTKVTAFPDGSSRLLVRNKRINSYEVISFETTDQGVVKSTRTLPFGDFSADVGHSSTSNRFFEKWILGMAWCKSLNLLCVLFALDDKWFNVDIYEPSSDLCLVTSLPVVQRVTSSKFPPNSIKGVFMTFEPDLIFVQFTFDLTGEDDDEDDDEEDTFSEVYTLPVLSKTLHYALKK